MKISEETFNYWKGRAKMEKVLYSEKRYLFFESEEPGKYTLRKVSGFSLQFIYATPSWNGTRFHTEIL